MVVRDDVAAAPRRDDRDLEQLGETGQLGGRPRPKDTGAGEDDRPVGAGEQLDDRPDLLVAGPRDGRPCRFDLGVSGPVSSSRSSGSDRRTGPGRPPSACRTASAIDAGDVLGGSSVRRPTWRARRASRPGRSPGTPRGRGMARSTWPTSANIGVESWRAVWMPMARFAPPTARVPRQTAGRPVSWPWASAMNAAPPSWRVATTRMPAARRHRGGRGTIRRAP